MISDPPSDDRHDHDAQLVELEHKLGFQQRAFDELNSVVLEQQSELESLRREVSALRQHFQRLTEQGPGEDLPHEKPPHY